jgi:hypothetical protein
VQALEVYERLVEENPEDPPDLVIGGSFLFLRSISSSTS